MPAERRAELRNRASHRVRVLVGGPLQLKRRRERRVCVGRRRRVVGGQRQAEDVRPPSLVEQLELQPIEGRADVAQRAPAHRIELRHQLLVEGGRGQRGRCGLRPQQPLEQVAELDEEVIDRRAAAQPLLQRRLVPGQRRPQCPAALKAGGRRRAGRHHAQREVSLADAHVADRAVSAARGEEQVGGHFGRQRDGSPHQPHEGRALGFGGGGAAADVAGAGNVRRVASSGARHADASKARAVGPPMREVALTPCRALFISMSLAVRVLAAFVPSRLTKMGLPCFSRRYTARAQAKKRRKSTHKTTTSAMAQPGSSLLEGAGAAGWGRGRGGPRVGKVLDNDRANSSRSGGTHASPPARGCLYYSAW